MLSADRQVPVQAVPPGSEGEVCTPPHRTDVNGEREQSVTSAFVSIADALVEGPDFVDLYGSLTLACAQILDVASVGLLLADRQGVLQVMAASCERTRDVEQYQLLCGQGPCLDCYRTGAAMSVPDLAAAQARWPLFAPVAIEAGIVSVHTVPMSPRGTTLGVLGLFGTSTGTLNVEDMALARAIGYVAGAALVKERAIADSAALAEQLQTALNSRVVLEQAKGAVAQLGGLDMGQAFAVMRRYSRDHNQPLAEVARRVVARESSPEVLLDHARAKGLLAPVVGS